MLIDEPNIHENYFEDLKKIFSGGTLEVDVKNKPDYSVGRTPIVMLTNKQIFDLSDETWNCRIRSFNIKQCKHILVHVAHITNP